jgi:hypothetical protein
MNFPDAIEHEDMGSYVKEWRVAGYMLSQNMMEVLVVEKNTRPSIWSIPTEHGGWIPTIIVAKYVWRNGRWESVPEHCGYEHQHWVPGKRIYTEKVTV